MTAPHPARTALELFVVTLSAASAGLMLCMLVVSGIAAHTGRDFSAYWAAGRQVAQHANPYDPAGLDASERIAGLPAGKPVMFVRNPPFALPLVYPIGHLGLHAAILTWLLVQLVCFVLAVHLLCRTQQLRRGKRLLLLYFFGPALICITNGQTSTLCLLGLAAFLYLHDSRPFAAGACLWLCALKPHLFVPFGVVLLLWILRERRYRILLGFGAALAASIALTAWLAPHAWTQYAAMLRTGGIENDTIPCVSELLRRWTFPNQRWISYVPILGATGWAVARYRKRRSQWNWNRDGSAVILASVVAAPYAWLNDLTVVVPAVCHAVRTTSSRWALVAIATFSAAVEIPLFLNAFYPSAVYKWTEWAAPVLVAWYIWARRSSTAKHAATSAI